jgi:hypothetical protein
MHINMEWSLVRREYTSWYVFGLRSLHVMSHQTLLLLVVPMLLVPGVVSIAFTYHLARYRVDLTPFNSPYDGASRIWQANVFRPSNYNPRGRRLLPWLYVLTILTALSTWGAAALVFYFA